MPDITIIDRINVAEMALTVGSHDGTINMIEGNHRTAVVDLLANLRHYCEANHVDWDDAEDASYGHWTEENDEE